MTIASPALESFIDETIRRGRAKKYTPTVLINMRRELGTIPAISKLVTNGDIQSGFKRLAAIGLLEWTIEAAVENFPTEFSKSDLACAKYRLGLARAPEKLQRSSSNHIIRCWRRTYNLLCHHQHNLPHMRTTLHQAVRFQDIAQRKCRINLRQTFARRQQWPDLLFQLARNNCLFRHSPWPQG